MAEKGDMAEKGLTGPQQAAVLLLSIGEEGAAEVLRHLGPKDVQKVGSAMSEVAGITQAQVKQVMQAFVDDLGTHTSLGVDQESYIRNMLVRAVGDEKASGLMDRILIGGSANGLDTLKWMDPRGIADMIRNEHPQIIAIVLAFLDADQSAEVLSYLPERTRPDLLLRVATLDTVQPQALNELNQILEAQVSGSNVKASSVGGARAAAEILNFVETSSEQEIMEHVKEVDAELSQQIEDLMFVFENLMDVDDTSIQALLREISSDTLLIALKGTDESLREKFFKNMSKRAAEMLRDDLDAKGPVRLSEVEAAQKEILGIARRMADEGTISLGGAGGDEYV